MDSEVIYKVGGLLLLTMNIWMLYFHKHKMGGESKDRAQDQLFSKWRMHLAFGWVSLIFFFVFLHQILHLENELPLPFSTFGWDNPILQSLASLIIFFSGFGLRLWATQTLGRYFTFQIGIREEHQIIQTGPYRWLRHPSYTGYLLMLVGLGLYLDSPLSLILTFPGALIFLLLRLHEEERMLIKFFGKRYEEYSKTSYKLIPFIF